jgi:hypothetical protein
MPGPLNTPSRWNEAGTWIAMEPVQRVQRLDFTLTPLQHTDVCCAFECDCGFISWVNLRARWVMLSVRLVG